MKEKPRVLFLCTHNAARSQMAEALLREYAGDRFDAYSAGLEPTAVHPLTRQVLVEAGVDVDGLRAKGVNEFLGWRSCPRLADAKPLRRCAVRTLRLRC